MEINGYSRSDIIIGCSSGSTSNAALSVIRISGHFLLKSYQSLFSKSLRNISPRKMYLTKIVVSGNILDELLFCFFEAPSSYSGENILELYPHGNVLNVQRIVKSFVVAFNLRLARPGEFTFRAFVNKKLNFAQVEGLELLLNANSQFAFNQGLQVLSGDLFRSYRHLYDEFVSMKSAINLLIDFSDDVGEVEARSLFITSFNKFGNLISELYKRVQIQASSALAPRILIYGPTNAGKSSFFNYILSEDRSIVSSIAGTTRDFISEKIEIDGDLFTLTDSAGVREMPENIVEEEGMHRSRALLSNSFFKVLVLSALGPAVTSFSSQDFDLILLTHSDLYSFSDSELEEFFVHYRCPVLFIGSGPIEPAPCSGSIGPLPINYSLYAQFNCDSGSIGPGHNSVTSIFKRLVLRKYLSLTSRNPILVDRHRTVISNIYTAFDKVKPYISDSDLGILSNKINEIGLLVNDLIGVVTPDDTLDLVFSRFCIGK